MSRTEESQTEPAPGKPVPFATLRAFEQDIALTFNEGRIKAPIHLAGGNEDQLIAYFQDHFRPGDWVATAWRSHYHALLAGVPPDEVRAKILQGRSITLTFPEYNFISSAIVGGILPIAVGIALGLKRAAYPTYLPRDEDIDMSDIPEVGEEWFKRAKLRRPFVGSFSAHGVLTVSQIPRVHVFVGDMTARTGAYHEAYQYAEGHALPISFIIEDNGKSVGTPTQDVWGTHTPKPHEERHLYELNWPHAGSGEWIKF